MNTTQIETVYRTFTMDFTAEVHYGVARDGAIWTRTRGRGWGGRYVNSAWRLTTKSEIPADAFNTGRKCRLPRSREAVAA